MRVAGAWRDSTMLEPIRPIALFQNYNNRRGRRETKFNLLVRLETDVKRYFGFQFEMSHNKSLEYVRTLPDAGATSARTKTGAQVTRASRPMPPLPCAGDCEASVPAMFGLSLDRPSQGARGASNASQVARGLLPLSGILSAALPAQGPGMVIPPVSGAAPACDRLRR